MQQVRGIRRVGGGGSWMFRVLTSVLRRMLLRRLIRAWMVCVATFVSLMGTDYDAAYNGVYLENGNLSDNLQPTATNPADVEKLWKLSEKLVGQDFTY